MPSHPRKTHTRRKTAKVLGEFKRRSLKSSSGRTVTSRAQAIAIALAEGRRQKRK